MSKGVSLVLILLVFWIRWSEGYPQLLPSYTFLMPSNLACPGIASSDGFEPSSVYENPANMVNFPRISISQSHSLRHFPLKDREVDQLDADAVALIIPFGSFAVFRGFSIAGEWGYDYRNLPYIWVPKEQLDGRQESWGWGWRFAWLRKGFVRQKFRFHIRQEGATEEIVTAKEFSRGNQVIILPWLRLGWASTTTSPSQNWQARKVSFFSITIRVLPYLWFSRQWQERMLQIGKVPLRTLRKHWSYRINIPMLWICRGYHGTPVVGFGFPHPFLSVSYAEGKNLLSYLTGISFPFFRDVHMGGYTLR